MSGIAALLLSLGHRVSGCDRVSTIEMERLQRLGLDFRMPQSADCVQACDAVIYSSAIRPGNPSFDAAVALQLPMFRRAEALAAIIEQKKGIVIAGMHGKTTVSSMTAHVLRRGGLRPSHYVGAEIPILGTNAHWDSGGDYFVAEGDESDGTIALYHPEHVILLNVEEEHLDFYKDLAAIERTFNQLLDQTKGAVFYCGDDVNARRLCGHRPGSISFGSGVDCDYQFTELETPAYQSIFKIIARGKLLGQVILNVPGRHNASNATGVIALASELGIPFQSIAQSLAVFRGARRRFEEKYRSEKYLVVDDYAHHPSEIKATLATARGGTDGRIVAFFQPHRYTRTQALRQLFGEAFHAADKVFVTNIYPASETPIPGITGQTVVDAVREYGEKPEVEYVPEVTRLRQAVARVLEPGDTILSLGAGNVHEQAALIAADLQRMEELQEAMGPGTIRLYEPLSKHTTLRVGGPAQFWVEPETVEGFSRILRYCRQTLLPLMVMGRGSNLLVRDGGVPGVVVHLKRGDFGQLRVDGNTIRAGVGVQLKQLSYAARDAGLGGFEWFEGIPGNVGGGLRMNAGAMGSETFDHVREVEYLDVEGNLHVVEPAQLQVNYRNVPFFVERFAVSALFEGSQDGAERIEEKLRESMQKRRSTQPAAASAGCTFKNPALIPAGKLIEELGLKNLSVGPARVSEVHGNFIVNDGGATASDVLALIDKICRIAMERRGILLETEVQIVGVEEPAR